MVIGKLGFLQLQTTATYKSEKVLQKCHISQSVNDGGTMNGSNNCAAKYSENLRVSVSAPLSAPRYTLGITNFKVFSDLEVAVGGL